MLDHLLTSYPNSDDHFDELFDAANEPRVHWRTFIDRISLEAPDLMRQRTEIVQHKVRENGVTYNVYDDSKGMQRPWNLNVLPLILPSDEWSNIEAAVTQRATLLNRILLDVYGKQTLLRDGALPPALIHGHSGFLRPCHNIQHLDDTALHFYAVDLARAPNGDWWVLGDRTQAPSGAGYALENRFVIARAFPELFRDLRVRHLAGFFATMRDSLLDWGRKCAAKSPSHTLSDSEQPLIVLLTPGPYNETYHEHAFLSRYLGVPLVEGTDLTVRHGMVWLKTLSGLQRVHVIMRRVDDEFCDPLELRADSALGVAGLTEVARLGNVLIANSLGSNLLESGALLGFLPNLCEQLLGEPLKMPSVGTWWCGESVALEEAIERLDQVIIKPSFPQSRQQPVFGVDLKGKAREAFIAKLRANPMNFVAQDLVNLSQAPVWKPGPPSQLTASAVGLRVYACATPDGYVVMPGGLTRVATGPDGRMLAMQRGSGSKDTWVLGGGSSSRYVLPARESSDAALSANAGFGSIRDDTHLSSRVAENLYWFGRYSERCDNVSRLMRTTLDLMINTPTELRGDPWCSIQSVCAWSGLLTWPQLPPMPTLSSLPTLSPLPDMALGHSQTQTQGQSQSQSQPQAAFQVQAMVPIWTDTEVEDSLLAALSSPSVPGLASHLQHLHRIASHLRERLSIDNWRTLNQMVQRFNHPDDAPSMYNATVMLDETITYLMTLAGYAMDGMTRDKGWRFLSIGRRIERLQFLCTSLQNGLQMSRGSNLDWLLELADSIVTYRSRYMARAEWLPVLDLLLLDESNPRSVIFQLDGILSYLEKLAETYGPCGADLIAPLKAELLALNPSNQLKLALNPNAPHEGEHAELIELLGRINKASWQVSEQISLRFFSYSGDHQTVSGSSTIGSKKENS